MENTKKKLYGITLLAMTLIIAIALIIFPLAEARAEGYASTSIGEAYYNGRNDKCKYEMYIDAKTITTNTSPVKVSSEGFNLYFKGTECKRSIFTTFYYDISYTLSKDNKTIKSDVLKFAANNTGNVLKDNRAMVSLAEIQAKVDNVKGTYLLSWHGTIKSAVTANINASANFEII